jgi:putative MFS transporter
MLVVILVWLAATSAGAAFAGSISTLTGWRVLAGFALGAYPPVMTSYLSELIEPRRRAALVLAGSAIALLGAPLGPLVVRHMNTSGLLGLEGWRWGLLSGAIGTAVFALAMSRLPESAQWLAAKGFHGRAALVRARFARSAPVRLSLPARGSGRNAANAATPPGDVGRLYLLSFLSPWATVAFPVLSGAVLITKGFRLDDTLLVIAVAALGPSIGVLVTSPWLDLVSRRSALLAAAAGMGVSGWFFVVEAQVSTVVAAYTAFIVSAVVYTSITNVFVAERSPTRRRSTLVSIAWTLNRISAAVAPFVLLPMLRRFGAVEMFVVVALTLAASIVLLWAWRGNDIYVQRQRQG